MLPNDVRHTTLTNQQVNCVGCKTGQKQSAGLVTKLVFYAGCEKRDFWILEHFVTTFAQGRRPLSFPVQCAKGQHHIRGLLTIDHNMKCASNTSRALLVQLTIFVTLLHVLSANGDSVSTFTPDPTLQAEYSFADGLKQDDLNALQLYWSVGSGSPANLSFALRVQSEGYAAVAFDSSGTMVGSTATICRQVTAAAQCRDYKMTARTDSGVSGGFIGKQCSKHGLTSLVPPADHSLCPCSGQCHIHYQREHGA